MPDALSASSPPPAPAAGAAHGENPPRRYRAFISYSHHDERIAAWLHRSLESYRVPSRLRGCVGEHGLLPERLGPIFRDRDDLASAGALGPRIETALAAADALLVVCSPDAVQSPWVDEEILAFKRLGRPHRIYALIVAGEPHAGDASECFPPALRFELDEDGRLGTIPTEPLAADLRPGQDGKTLARLKLLSGLLGVELDTLRQRETARRQRRLAAITALAVLVMLITSYLAVHAVLAQRAAERRQEQAEALVDFMLGDLNDKLAEVQRLDIMAEVDDKAMAYFESLPTADVTDESREQRGKALVRIGSVRMDQGDLPAARASYLAAEKLVAPLAAKAPNDIPRQLAHAEILAFIGTTHWHQGDLDAAQRNFQSAQRILLRARARSGDDPGLRYQLAILDNNLGHVLEARGDLDGAAAQYQDLLVLMQGLAASNPANSEWHSTLGAAHNNLGKVALMRGDLAGAIYQYQADFDIQSRLAARDPQDNDRRDNRLRVQATLGRTQALAGRFDVAIHHLREAVTTAEQLVASAVGSTGTQERLGLYSTQLARQLRLRGELASARGHSQRAMTVFDTLTRLDATNSGWQRGYAEARSERAEQARAAGEDAIARTEANDAIALLVPLATGSNDRSTLLALANARLVAAAATSDPAAATSLRETALHELQAITSGRADPRLLALQAQALLELGRTVEAQAIVSSLQQSGYREPGWIDLLARQDRVIGVASTRNP